LTLLAAQCDQAVINIVAVGRSGSWQATNGQAFADASELTRHWRASEVAKILASLRLPDDDHLVQTVDDCLRRYGALREKRHRAIHDALVVGYDYDQGAVTLAVGYLKAAGKTTYAIGTITPEDISAIARDFGELRADLDHCLWMYRRLGMTTAL
jgi:hypothetical protein